MNLEICVEYNEKQGKHNQLKIILLLFRLYSHIFSQRLKQIIRKINYQQSILSHFNTFKKMLYNFQNVVNRYIVINECEKKKRNVNYIIETEEVTGKQETGSSYYSCYI